MEEDNGGLRRRWATTAAPNLRSRLEKTWGTSFSLPSSPAVLFPSLCQVLAVWKLLRAVEREMGRTVNHGLGLVLLRDAALSSATRVVVVDMARVTTPAGRRSLFPPQQPAGSSSLSNAKLMTAVAVTSEDSSDQRRRSLVMTVHRDGLQPGGRQSDRDASPPLLLHRSATSAKLGMIVSTLPDREGPLADAKLATALKAIRLAAPAESELVVRPSAARKRIFESSAAAAPIRREWKSDLDLRDTLMMLASANQRHRRNGWGSLRTNLAE
jgi:hypothetical protein